MSRVGWQPCVLLLLVAVAFPTSRAMASPVYNNGPLLSGTPNVYYIWYGDWSGNTATTILLDFITNLSGTPYMNVITSFSTGSYTISNQVNFAGSYFIDSSTNASLWLGASLDATTETQIESIVAGVLAANPSWAADSQGIFDVLTASSVSVTGFNSGSIQFCGWHYSTNWGGGSLGTQYGFIGDPAQGNNCNVPLQNAPSANGNFGADAMASVIAHELFETVTDPIGSGWWDSIAGSSTNQSENADMCAWQFGSSFTTGTGGHANVTLNGTDYLLQEQWLNQGGGTGLTGGVCTTSLALSAPLATPEPASFMVLLPGLLGLAGVHWRRQNHGGSEQS